MKQMEVTEKKIGENTFYLKPFPAFVAVNISGELAALLTPFIGSLAPFIGGNINSGETPEEKNKGDILDADVNDVLPAFTKAFSSLSGDKFERLMKKLLIDHKNISVESESTEWNVKLLTYDLANEVFCGDVQDMYILCFEVIRLNFQGFFGKIGARFGSLQALFQQETPNINAGEN